MNWVDNIVNTLDLIVDGVDPSTGEIIDTDTLKQNPEFQRALRALGKKYRSKSSKRKGTYAKYEEAYPNHVIIMKEGFFYSAHNKSAAVLNRILDYALAEDYLDRISTGGPNYEKISSALEEEGVSFILVEGGELVERFDGEDPFKKYVIDDENVKQDSPLDNTVFASENSKSISEMARRLSEKTVHTFGVKLRYEDIASWLVSEGDLKESEDNNGITIRVPTKQGEQHGIYKGKRVNSSGLEYEGVFLEPPGQQYIRENLGRILKACHVTEKL